MTGESPAKKEEEEEEEEKEEKEKSIIYQERKRAGIEKIKYVNFNNNNKFFAPSSSKAVKLTMLFSFMAL